MPRASEQRDSPSPAVPQPAVVVLHEPEAEAVRDAIMQGPVVIVSDRAAWAADLAATSRHAWGLVPAAADPSMIQAAVGAVAAGLIVRPALSAEPPREPAAPQPVRATARIDTRGPMSVEPLTPREREVLQQLGEGLSNRAIAEALGISDHTVKFHLAAIFGKLGAATRTEAVRTGLRQGLIAI